MRNILNVLKKGIGHTPLYEFLSRELENGNRIFVKAEFLNPTGSHYDRIYWTLFNEDISSLESNPPEYLIEVSSGNAAASFAWFCKKFRFKCKVILPYGIPSGFIQNIQKNNPECVIELIEDKNNYLKPAPLRLKRELQEAKNKGKYLYCPNHSRRKETLKATEEIAKETIEQLKIFGIEKLDYFIGACGNGATIIGPGRILKNKFNNLTIIAFEPESAPVGSVVKYPTKFLNFSFSPHNLFGTGAWGIYFPFIHDKKYNFCNLVDEIYLITREDFVKAMRLKYKIGVNVGFTSLVSLYLVFKIIKEKRCKNCNFLVLFYDRGEKYEWLY